MTFHDLRPMPGQQGGAGLYSLPLLRLAADSAEYPRIDSPHATAERRSPVCGSRVAVDLALTSDTLIDAIGGEIRACALGQASATLLFRHATGRTPAQLATARDQLAAWLSGEGPPPDWPGIGVLAPARATPARHASILLPFAAAAEAAFAAAAEAAAHAATRNAA